jgi:ribonuclease D
MSYIYITEPHQADALSAELRSLSRFALDCEAAGFHRYSDRLCLVQLSTPAETYVVDPQSFDPTELLKGPLEDPAVEIVMHGADFDLRLLLRDLGIRLQGLFDTQVAAALLGESQLGLAALLESRFDVKLSKKHQRADWAQRPLTDGMLEYAASDTRYLLDLADLLVRDLDAAGRRHWAHDECRALEENAQDIGDADAPQEDPVVRVKGARDLPPRVVTALRTALEWRDEVAREWDRATFRVVGDQPLIEAVMNTPRDAAGLKQIKGFPGRLASSDGKDLLKRLRTVAELPEDELKPYPRYQSRGPGRPPPEVEAVVDRLKAARNSRADELGLDRGTLLSNAVIIGVAMAHPTDLESLRAVEGLRDWQVEAVGSQLVSALQKGR